MHIFSATDIVRVVKSYILELDWLTSHRLIYDSMGECQVKLGYPFQVYQICQTRRINLEFTGVHFT